MKTASAARDALLASDKFEVATLYEFGFPSGTTYWTNNITDLSYGGHTYLAACPIINVSSIRVTAGTEVSTLDIIINPGAITVGGLTMYQLAIAGVLDAIRVSIKNVYMTTWGTIVGNALTVFEGTGIEVNPTSTAINLTVKASSSKLNSILPARAVSAFCPYQVYDTKCEGSDTLHTLRTAHSMSKTVVSTGTSTAAVGVDALASYLWGGTPSWFTFTSGALTGVSRLIKTVTVGTPGILVPDVPLVAAPSAGDTLVIYQGCRKTIVDCYSLFNNVSRFGGFPVMPTEK